MRIGLDIDGVIRPWHISMYRYFVTIKNYGGDEYQFWNYFRGLPESTQKYYVSLPMMYLDTVPTKDVLAYLPKLADIAEIYYITACGEGHSRITYKFFNIYDLPFKENIIFAEDKTASIRLLSLDFFVDDLASHVAAAQGLTNAYLFKATHNRDDRENFKVIGSLQELYDKVKNYETKENSLGGLSRP